MSQQHSTALLNVARPGPGELRRLWLSVALATGAALAAIGLLATSGYLISRAAERPPILMLMVAIVAVRAFGLTRAVMRYSERLASHDLALRQLGTATPTLLPQPRTARPGWPGEPQRRPAQPLRRRRRHAQGPLPARCDPRTRLAARADCGDPRRLADAALRRSHRLPLTGPRDPAAAVAERAPSPHASARRQAPARARLTSELIEGIDGASELALAGQSHIHSERLAESDDRLARIARSDALASSAAATAGGVLAGAGVLALLIVAIPAVHSGVLSGVLLAALVFLLLAAYDSILPLSAAARNLRLCATAAGRLQRDRRAASGRQRPDLSRRAHRRRGAARRAHQLPLRRRGAIGARRSRAAHRARRAHCPHRP